MRWIKMLAMAVFTALLVCLTGCGGASGDEAAGETVMVSEGFFMPCTNGSYLMITDNGYCSAVELCSDDTGLFGGLSAGDVIRVSHDPVRETFPGSTVVYELEKVSDGGIEDIPGDILEQLEGMGWVAVTGEGVSDTGIGAVTSEMEITENTDVTGETGSEEWYFMPCTNGVCFMIDDSGRAVEMYNRSDVGLFDGLTAGDKIRVTYGVSSGDKIEYGLIRASFPGSTDVYGIEKVSDGSMEDIPGDVIEQLREMGWKPVTVIPDSENFDMDKLCAAVMISYPGSDEPMRDHVLCFMEDGGVWEALSADEDGNASGFTEKLYSCDEAALTLMTEPCFLGSITQAEAELLQECIAAIDPDCEYYDRGDDAYPAVVDDSYFTVYFYGNDEKDEKYSVIMGVYGNNSGASYRCTDVNAVQAMKVISRCSFLADRLTGCET